jgi:hypothetical protein
MQPFLALDEEAGILMAFAYLSLSVFNKDNTNSKPEKHETFVKVGSSVPLDNPWGPMDSP